MCDVEDLSIFVSPDGKCEVCRKNDDIKLQMDREIKDGCTGDDDDKVEASISVCLPCVYRLVVGIVQHDAVQKVAHPTECGVCKHPAALTFTDCKVAEGEIVSLCHECVASVMFYKA